MKHEHSNLLRRVKAEEVERATAAVLDAETIEQTRAIVLDVRTRGTEAVREHAHRFGERTPEQPLVLGRDAMDRALASLPPDDRSAMEHAAARIDAFARAQRGALQPATVPIPGGEAGHTIVPIESAGCYAPAGRHPLPSSVLMTSIPARVGGCARVVVASPGAQPAVLAAAAVAGADELLAVGGAHAIAALAFGFEGFAPCDFIAGPGNRWVTAAKHIVSASVGIDMLAGPSELLIIADDTADPEFVAADLLAQAEHDTDASAMLISTSATLIDAVEQALAAQLESLETRDVARVGLSNGFACHVDTIDRAIDTADRIAAEHLEIMTRDAEAVAHRVRHAGAVFIGGGAAEALGDYGAGPNHTLPTGGAARCGAGLSVLDFVRVRTWMRIDDPAAARDLCDETARLARMEGLAAHAVSARLRSHA